MTFFILPILKQNPDIKKLRINHHQLTSTGKKIEGGATQQHVCHENDNDDDEAGDQRTNINDIIRNRLMGLIMHRHLIDRLGESSDNDEEGE